MALFICPTKRQPMQDVKAVGAIAGRGLEGDRYADGNGSYNQGKPGNRQVTLINALFFNRSGFEYIESRRNIVTGGVELNWLIGKEFKIGEATFRGFKYCEPCGVPSNLCKKSISFQEAFFDRGGIIAEILEGGIIRVGDAIVPPPKKY